jgi:hypothetical protein
MLRVAHLHDFQVVELRRYVIVEGGRERFSRYFESYFPEAHQQLGAIFFGHFLERRSPCGFTMLRGFKDLDARAVVCGSFYYGPLWKEHRQTINDLLVDSDDVLLLRPLSPERSVLVLPAVDPVREEGGAQGIVAAQIFPLQADRTDAFAAAAEPHFAAYRAAGAREAGVLVTLDAVNNFPQLPIRDDGPFFVWLGVIEDEHALERSFRPLAERAQRELAQGGLLRGAPELALLDPGARSRLRWYPGWRA